MPDIVFHLHIPKTAGTAVREALKRSLAPEEILEWYPANPYVLELWLPELTKLIRARPRTRLVTGHYLYGAHRALQGQSYKYFTVVRDPASRILSHFVHDIQYNLAVQPQSILQIILASATLSEYVGNPVVAYFYNNLQTRFISGIGQARFGDKSDTEIINVCKDNVERDFILVAMQSRLVQSLMPLGEAFGLKSLDIREENSKGRCDPRQILTSIDLHQLEELNKLDYMLVDALVHGALSVNSASVSLAHSDNFKSLLLDSYKIAITNLVHENQHLNSLSIELQRQLAQAENQKKLRSVSPTVAD